MAKKNYYHLYQGRKGRCDCGRMGTKRGAEYVCARCRELEAAGMCGGPQSERGVERTRTRRAGNNILAADYERGLSL